jgi:uncharacterized protein (TIGR02246 family)
MIKSIISAASFVAVFSTCAIAQTQADIQKLEDTFTEAFNKENASTLASMFTEDAYLLPNNGDFIQGRAAIELFWQNNVKLVKGLKLTTTYVQTLGSDAALEIGRSINSINSQEVEGKYVILWRKAGASWKIAVDTFNRTKPPLK